MASEVSRADILRAIREGAQNAVDVTVSDVLKAIEKGTKQAVVYCLERSDMNSLIQGVVSALCSSETDFLSDGVHDAFVDVMRNYPFTREDVIEIPIRDGVRDAFVDVMRNYPFTREDVIEIPIRDGVRDAFTKDLGGDK